MLFKVVESSGLETVVDVTEYNRGEVLEKAFKQMYGESKCNSLIGSFRITPIK